MAIEMGFISGHFFLRNQGGRIMMIGVLDEVIDIEKDGEIWLLQTIISDCKRYKAPEQFKGLRSRADQILCSTVKESDLIPIKQEQA